MYVRGKMGKKEGEMEVTMVIAIAGMTLAVLVNEYLLASADTVKADSAKNDKIKGKAKASLLGKAVFKTKSFSASTSKYVKTKGKLKAATTQADVKPEADAEQKVGVSNSLAKDKGKASAIEASPKEVSKNMFQTEKVNRNKFSAKTLLSKSQKTNKDKTSTSQEAKLIAKRKCYKCGEKAHMAKDCLSETVTRPNSHVTAQADESEEVVIGTGEAFFVKADMSEPIKRWVPKN